MGLWKQRSEMRVATLMAAVLFALLAPGCGPSSPTPPTPPPTDATGEPEPVGETGEPDEQLEAPVPEPPVAEVPEPVEPEPVAIAVEIPGGPVSGLIDGQPFVLASASIHASVVTLTGEGGRSVSVILFDQADGSVDLTEGDWPFGSPHVVLRTGGGEAAMTWTDGYRLRLDLEAGTVFLELPEGRGLIAGLFDTQ